MNRQERHEIVMLYYKENPNGKRDKPYDEWLEEKLFSLLTKEPSLTHTEREEEACNHIDIGTDGGGDFCKICGKRW